MEMTKIKVPSLAFQKFTAKRNSRYRCNIGEDIRTLERRATQSGAYDDIIKFLAAKRRRGDDVEYEYVRWKKFRSKNLSC